MGVALAVAALAGCSGGRRRGGSAWYEACKGDIARFCHGSHSRRSIILCLSQIEGSVTPACHDALSLMRNKAEQGQIGIEKTQY